MLKMLKASKYIVPWFRDDVFSKLFRNAGALLSGDVISTIFGIGSMAFMVRALGPHQFGVLVLMQTYMDIIRVLVEFKPSLAVIKYGAEALEQEREEYFKEIIKIGVAIDVLTGVLVALLSLSLAYWIGSWQDWPHETIQMIMLYSIARFFYIQGTPTAILRLFDRFRLAAAQQVISSTFKLLLAFCGWYFHVSLWYFVLILTVSEIFTDLLLIWMGHSVLLENGVTGWWRCEFKEWRKIIKFTFWTNITTTLDMPVNHLDKVIVAMVSSLEGVALYKIFKQVSQVMTKVASSLRDAIFPQFSSLVANRKGYSAVQMAVRSGILILLVSFPMVILASILSPWWMSLIFGEQYAKGLLALTIFLMLRCVSMSFSTIHPLFTAMGFVHFNVPILAAANAIYLSAAWYLGTLYGITGVVLAYGMQFSSIILLKMFVISSRFEQVNSEKRFEIV